MTTIRTGSTALLVYPAGDVDEVEVLALSPDAATVRLPDGREYRTVPEDLGIGVDDELVAEYDDQHDNIVARLRDENAAFDREVRRFRAYDDGIVGEDDR